MKNAQEMKAENRLNVLRILRRESFSRSELAARTGLTRAAMSLIIGELLAHGVVLEAPRRKSSAGRRPIPVELNPQFAHSLGLTISRTGAQAGVADFCGRIVCRRDIEISGLSRRDALRRIKSALGELIRDYPPPSGRWLGLGISTPGPVDVDAGTILNPPNFDTWHNVCLAAEMKDLGVGEVCLENNAQALTMAERTFGAGQLYRSFVLLEVEAGIGSGIVSNDRPYSGWRGFGNEIGHTSIDMNGPRCSCGLRGCVEMYAAVPRLLAKARKKSSAVRNWQTFMDRAAGGDVHCRKLLKEQARALGTAVVNIINVLELDAVVLAGDVLYRGEMLRAEMEYMLANTAINRWLRHVPVLLSPLGEKSELAAAAGIPAEKFFQGSIKPTLLRRLGRKTKVPRTQK